MIESSSVITGIRRRDAIREKITTFERYPNMMFQRFKFSVLGEKELDIVMWVKDPT
jgi:hypothetical protein